MTPAWSLRHGPNDPRNARIRSGPGRRMFAAALLAIAGCAGREPLLPDGGARHGCTPSALVARVDPARLRADLHALVDLGELFFSNEERDRAGALAYVGALKDTVAPRQVVGFIGVDMVAFPPADRELTLVTRPAHRGLAIAMLAAISRWTALRATLSIRDDCGSGDEGAFWSGGYAAMYAIDAGPDGNPGCHRSSDVLATLDLACHAEATRGLVATLAALADRQVGARRSGSGPSTSTFDLRPSTFDAPAPR